MQRPIPKPVLLPVGVLKQSDEVEPVGWVAEFLAARAIAPRTRREYEKDLQDFQQWYGGEWETVTPGIVRQYRDDLLAKGKAATTVRRRLGTLKAFYKWLGQMGRVAGNPTLALELPPVLAPEANDLSEEEVAQIYAAVLAGRWALRDSPVETLRDRALVSVLLHGLRAQSVSLLDVGNYDGLRLHVRQDKADSKGFVPLLAWARTDIEVYLEWRRKQGEVVEATSPLFVSYSRRSLGQRLTYWGIREVMDRLREATGIDVHAHRFRHTFATTLLLKGMDSFKAMTLTRHKSVQAFKRYVQRAEQAAAEQEFWERLE
ncbi:tyrosine-type recombinase/integrase [Trichothermofontia sp.]